MTRNANRCGPLGDCSDARLCGADCEFSRSLTGNLRNELLEGKIFYTPLEAEVLEEG